MNKDLKNELLAINSKIKQLQEFIVDTNDLLVINSRIKQIQEFIETNKSIHADSISETLVILEKKKTDVLKEIQNEKMIFKGDYHAN